jgi:hypothetical protein
LASILVIFLCLTMEPHYLANHVLITAFMPFFGV